MPNDYKIKLVEYFKKNLKKGYTSESLKIALFNQGYSKIIIERAWEQANTELSKKAPIVKEKPKITYKVYDENNQQINLQKTWWERLLGV